MGLAPLQSYHPYFGSGVDTTPPSGASEWVDEWTVPTGVFGEDNK